MTTFFHRVIGVSAAVLFASATSAAALDAKDVKGVFVNEDGFVKAFGFCGNGKGAAGHPSFMVNRGYFVQDDKIHMNANGNFVFTLSADGTQLISADAFTKEWGSETPYILDTTQKIDC